MNGRPIVVVATPCECWRARGPSDRRDEARRRCRIDIASVVIGVDVGPVEIGRQAGAVEEERFEYGVKVGACGRGTIGQLGFHRQLHASPIGDRGRHQGLEDSMIVDGVDFDAPRGIAPCAGGGSHVKDSRGRKRVRGFRVVNWETMAGLELVRALDRMSDGSVIGKSTGEASGTGRTKPVR